LISKTPAVVAFVARSELAASFTEAVTFKPAVPPRLMVGSKMLTLVEEPLVPTSIFMGPFITTTSPFMVIFPIPA
jgi:hypothetical protein